jgi:L-aspartate oxidase
MKARCQQGETRQFDVLVIGAGLAGLHYCTQLLAKHPKLTIALLCKANLAECNSRYAQGGIAAVLAPNDSFIAHCHDTLAAGDGLCYPPAVELIISQGPQAIADLQHDYQLSFDRQTNGKLDLGQEGGHQHRRIAHCGDQTGRSLMQQLIQKIQEFPQIHVFEHHIAVNLISQKRAHDTERQAEIVGAYVLDCNNNQIHAYLSRCVVLATGGAGKTYRYTTNPMIATGDGVAMAYRAGACISHMEFYQFHPTLLHHEKLNNFLISEALRGEGAILKNADTHERFMQKYAPEELELATRDVVARAIFTEIENSNQPYVYLDISHKPKAFLKEHFPHIYASLLEIGIDISQHHVTAIV